MGCNPILEQLFVFIVFNEINIASVLSVDPAVTLTLGVNGTQMVSTCMFEKISTFVHT